MRRVMPPLIALCLGFAPAPVYRERPGGRGDLEKLQGEWVLVAEVHRGKARAPSEWRAVFSGRDLFKHDGADVYRWEVTSLDPTTSPKAMDMRCSAGQPGSFLEMMAAYSLEGDVLHLCYNFDWSKRPEDLSGGPAAHLRILKRKKP